jgi:hypothetical protein
VSTTVLEISIGIDEVEGLAHRQEHLVVHPLRDVVQAEPLGPGVLVAFLDIGLTAQHGGHQAQAKGNLSQAR